ncbi:hypothetical protein DdX_21343 [Ditylenchus destructor]|uniref:Uncharacterized protein n=1 Tax=Ditylenchus destructor TaxID=166010 RepID=A0AAD4QRF1_9BILA|nr:hypothetical protein DdX_21343 [Ditylenchus destructor]
MRVIAEEIKQREEYEVYTSRRCFSVGPSFLVITDGPSQMGVEYLRTKALKGCTYFAVVDVSGQTRVCNTLAGQAVEEAVVVVMFPSSPFAEH